MLAGSRVAIRAVTSEDVAVLSEIANDPRVRTSVVGIGWPTSHAHDAYLAKDGDEHARVVRLAVVELDSHRVVGMTGLWDVDWRNRTASTGIKIHPTSWGKGFGLDAVRLLTSWAFLEVGLNRLWTSVFPSNAASLRIYGDLCGWQVEGRLRESVFRSGVLNDVLILGQLRREFDRQEWKREYSKFLLSPLLLEGDESQRGTSP